MQIWTDGDLREYAPHAIQGYIDALVQGAQELQRAGIDTPLRWCHFVSQWHAETGGYTILVEDLCYKTAKRLCEVWPERFGKPSNPANLANPLTLACLGNPEKLGARVYGGRMGNDTGKDGFLYRGRGFNQLTGEEAYRRASKAIGRGNELVEHPDLLENPAISLLVAIDEWTACNCNFFADRNNGRAIGNAINRGNAFSSSDPIGYQARKDAFERAWSIWGTGSIPSALGIDLGDAGVAVENVQLRLAELHYPIGKADGVYGNVMRRAIVAFKSDWQHHGNGDLEPGTLIGDKTLAAIGQAAPVPVSGERATATASELAAAGSQTVATAQQQQVAGKVAATGGVIAAAQETGALDAAKAALPQVDLDKLSVVVKTQQAIEPALVSAKWCLAHAWWVIPIVGGVWLWSGGAKLIAERLKKHRTGVDLSK